MNTHLITQNLKNACQTIERQQEEPLDLDQVSVIYDICEALNINPILVLDQATLQLIEGHPEFYRRQTTQQSQPILETESDANLANPYLKETL